MTKRTKGLLILLTPFFMGFLLGILVGGGCSRHSASKTASGDAADSLAVEASGKNSDDGYYLTDSAAEAADAAFAESDSDVFIEEPHAKEILYAGPRLAYSKLFADLNEEHLEMARRVGLSVPPATRDNIDLSRSGLVKISDNDYYIVDELRYSVPYLTKGAAKELDRIAKAFADSLSSKKLLDYKLVVSSVLRTEEDVNKLRRSGNPNASENSAHCYGTTFDITYTRYFREDESETFMQPYELTKVLAEVLRDEKAAGRILVKYERKEHCFHITSKIGG